MVDLGNKWSATRFYIRACDGGKLLYLIFRNDLDKGIVKNKLLKFADDTRVSGAALKESDFQKNYLC